jgi:hypothetical protein
MHVSTSNDSVLSLVSGTDTWDALVLQSACACFWPHLMAMQDLELFLELPFYNFQMFYSAGKILRFHLTSHALIFHVLGATHSIRSLEQTNSCAAIVLAHSCTAKHSDDCNCCHTVNHSPSLGLGQFLSVVGPPSRSRRVSLLVAVRQESRLDLRSTTRRPCSSLSPQPILYALPQLVNFLDNGHGSVSVVPSFFIGSHPRTRG